MYSIRSCKIILSLLVFLGVNLMVAGQVKNDYFMIGELRVAPGEMKAGYLEVATAENIDCSIPVTVINGKAPGKVLALVAGVHGYEYPPILSLYRLKQKISPQTLSGTIIMVHIANRPGFQKRIIYYNPYDWKNLNRVFPGDPKGSQAERIAYVLVEEVVKKCDFLIDLHCGDGNEALIPYTYWMLSGDKKMDAVTKDLALAFGIKHIIIDQGRTKDITESKYLGNTAVLFQKPAITTESGYLGKSDEESIVRNIKGILNVMKLLKMISGSPAAVDDPIWIDKYEVVYSDSSGLFYPQTRMGYYVKKGEKIGYVTDYLGEIIREYTAPFTGIVLYIINTPPANQGEPLFEIGRIKE